MLLAAPTDIHAPVRVLGNAALMLPYGLLWGAARRFDGRSAPFEAVSIGALARGCSPPRCSTRRRACASA